MDPSKEYDQHVTIRYRHPPVSSACLPFWCLLNGGYGIVIGSPLLSAVCSALRYSTSFRNQTAANHGLGSGCLSGKFIIGLPMGKPTDAKWGYGGYLSGN